MYLFWSCFLILFQHSQTLLSRRPVSVSHPNIPLFTSYFQYPIIYTSFFNFPLQNIPPQYPIILFRLFHRLTSLCYLNIPLTTSYSNAYIAISQSNIPFPRPFHFLFPSITHPIFLPIYFRPLTEQTSNNVIKTAFYNWSAVVFTCSTNESK